MRILQLKAARGWSAIQASQRFLITEETIASWMRRLDEGGEEGLIRMGEPVNKYPDFVGYVVRYLKGMHPTLGKAMIARMLARAGLHLGATTVGRMRKRGPSKEDVSAQESSKRPRSIKARRPNDVWHVDLTTMPTRDGFWVPRLPFAVPQRWPFCWWMAIVLDSASRIVVGFAEFRRRPTSYQACVILGRALKRAGVRPRTIITDKGKEFYCARFKGWCRQRSLRPRFGAAGKHGSIVVLERFIRTMKAECTRRILVPFGLGAMRHEITCHATWYNECRPHAGLDGRTPMEVYRDLRPANTRPRYEPRESWPSEAQIKGERGARLALVLRSYKNRPHLPVVELKLAV